MFNETSSHAMRFMCYFGQLQIWWRAQFSCHYRPVAKRQVRKTQLLFLGCDRIEDKLVDPGVGPMYKRDRFHNVCSIVHVILIRVQSVHRVLAYSEAQDTMRDFAMVWIPTYNHRHLISFDLHGRTPVMLQIWNYSYGPNLWKHVVRPDWRVRGVVPTFSHLFCTTDRHIIP
jgi:hypothetical protein